MTGETLVYGKHTKAVTSVMRPTLFTDSDGNTLAIIASGSLDKTVHLWDQYTGQLHQIITYNAPVNALAWSPNRTLLAVGCADGRAYVYTYIGDKMMLTATYQGHQKSIRTLAWSFDGNYIASASEDYAVHIWQATATQVLTYHGHVGTVNALAWSPTNYHIASASNDRTVQVWDALLGNIDFTYTGHITNDQALEKPDQDPPAVVTGVTWEPEGTYIASATSNGMIHIWDSTSGTFMFEQTPDKPAAIRSIAWSADNYNIATGGDNHMVQQFGVTTS
jgi:WD40 repeat protein